MSILADAALAPDVDVLGGGFGGVPRLRARLRAVGFSLTGPGGGYRGGPLPVPGAEHQKREKHSDQREMHSGGHEEAQDARHARQGRQS
jgi:hypothetical protein